MQQLSSLDAFFLHGETEEAGTEVGLVSIYDQSTAPGGAVRLRDIVAHVEDRLHTSPVFRRRMVRTPLDLDNPYWIEDEHFDIEFHIRHIRLPDPGDWRQLHILVAKIHARRIDLTKPAWEMWVIEGLDRLDGVAPGSFAIFYRFHHTAIDGHSGRDIISGLHDLEPTPAPTRRPDTWSPERRPGGLELLARAGVNNLVLAPARLGAQLVSRSPKLAKPAWRQLADLRSGAASARPSGFERTRFNCEVSPHRVLDHQVFSLAQIKEIRRAVDGATINDVVVSVIGGGVRKYLAMKGEAPRSPLTTGIPVDSRPGEDSAAGGNHIIINTVPLAADVDDPLERLARVQQSTASMKAKGAVAARELVAVAEQAPAALFGWGIKAAIQAGIGVGGNRMPAFNTLLTNVPGPQAPIYFHGARATRMFGVGTVAHGLAVLFVIFSYAGEVTISVIGCRDALPDPAVLTECVAESYAELAAATSRADVGD